jgi:hypothetical protein
MTAVAASDVLRSWSGRPARPRTQHDCHHDTKVKPEGATSVIELLMIGGKNAENRPAGPNTNTARLSPRYVGKTRGCNCSN